MQDIGLFSWSDYVEYFADGWARLLLCYLYRR